MLTRLLEWVETRTGFLVSVGVISVGMALLRLVRIAFPPTRVFDEVYSPVFAWNFLQGEKFFDVHPILAELPHTIGLLLFGDTPLGWRFSPWLWGIVFTWGAALTALFLTRRRLAGVLAALLVSLDTAFFIYGRTGLPDMFLLSQLSLALALLFFSARLENWKGAMFAAFFSGVFLGNVVATKWLGLAGIASVWFWLLINLLIRFLRRRGKTNVVYLLPNIHSSLLPIFFLLIPVVVYGLWLLPLLGWQWPPQEMWESVYGWHKRVWDYHYNLKAAHPYGSEWWQWPLLRKPVLFFWKQGEGGQRVINATGNVVLWWGGFAALLLGAFSLLRKFQTMILWAVCSALMFWLPWIFIPRVSFNYHYFASFFFEVLLLAMALVFLLDRPRYRAFAVIFIVAALGSFVALYPSATAMFVPDKIAGIKLFF